MANHIYCDLHVLERPPENFHELAHLAALKDLQMIVNDLPGQYGGDPGSGDRPRRR